MSKDVVAYPLSSINTVVARYSRMLTNLNVVGFISSGTQNCNPANSDIPIYDDFGKGILESDTLLILPLADTTNVSKILQHINLAIQSKKNIISLHKFDSTHSEQISNKCECENVTYLQLANQKHWIYDDLENRIWNMNTPLIVCAGISEQCNLPHIELELRKRFLEDGYRVSQVGSFIFANAFGLHTIPDFMYSKTLDEVEKTLSFNRYMKEIETKEQPEIFILGMPRSLCPINDTYHLGFGNIPFLMSHAIASDYTIINMNMGEYKQRNLDSLSDLLENRFKLKPDAWIMSNIMLDLSDSDYGGSVRYFSSTDAAVKDAINKSDGQFINLNKKCEIDSLYESIIDSLSNN